MDPGIPEDIIEFINARIASVVQLEVLLLLHAEQGKQWTADELAEQLRIEPAWAAGQLESLCNDGLLVCQPAAVLVYRYQPRTPELAAMVDALARIYAERRVSVISLIFSKPPDPLRDFADAFRFRKNKSDDKNRPDGKGRPNG